MKLTLELKNLYKGEDIYVLGSAHSMDFIDPKFFENKISIGANSIWKFFSVTYSVFKHKQFIQAAIDAGKITICSKHDCGDIDKPLINEDLKVNYMFTHKRGRFGDLEENFQENLDAIGKDDDIFVSYSTITSCIHLAAYMGAKNIILAGHDCGYLDGISHKEGYAEHIKEFYKTDKNFNQYYNPWFEGACQESIKLKKKIKEVYGCSIYSLNPFINFRLEGHKYSITK